MPYLIQTEGRGSGAIFELSHGKSIVGRHVDCEVVVQDDSVSRRHALIEVESDVSFIEDLQSSNGTTLNDEPVMERRQLADGDMFRISKVQFCYRANCPSLPDRKTSLASSADTQSIKRERSAKSSLPDANESHEEHARK